MAKLVVRIESGEQEHVLRGEAVAVGKAADNDIVIADATVSRHHARIVRKGDHYEIEDLDSTNGCYVNGNRVWRSPLDNGDEVGLGMVRCRFVGDPAVRPSRLPKPPKPLPKVPLHPQPAPGE